MAVNKVILIGNVGGDPILRATNDSREIASFSLATSDHWKDKRTGERQERTEWHKIVIFSQGLVGIVKSYVKKGTKLYIEGSLQTRKWTDDHGVERYITEIILQAYNSSLQILTFEAKDKGEKSTKDFVAEARAKHEGKTEEFTDEFDDDIPF